MRDVLIALVPAAVAGVVYFGMNVALIIALSVATAVASEALIQKVLGRPITVSDGSAAVAGLLFALVLPPTVDLWLPVIGGFLLIFLGKQVFGGLGYNPFNPAHVGRAILTASWPVAMTTWVWPRFGALEAAVGSAISGAELDALSGATPLALMKYHGIQVSYKSLFLGNVAGCIGETCVPALLIGAAYLLYKGHITWHTPLSFMGTVAVMMLIMGQDPLFHLLSGGLMIGAFFMATDYVTSPYTLKGQVIFGVGCGILTALIRIYGGYPEGVCYAILLMNALTPLIDKFTKPRRFGEVARDSAIRVILRYAVVLGLVCAISALILSGTYDVTRSRIEEGEAQDFYRALAEVLAGDHEFTPIEGLRGILGGRSNTVTEAYIASDGRFSGLAVKASPIGYGGPIDMVVGILPEGKISGVRIVAQSETPGLGTEIAREAFLGQFVGVSEADSLRVRKDGGSIDAVTGATVSSRAVATGVREALEVFEFLRDQGLLTVSK
jgi:electron transport complex protein RnfD